MHLCVSEIAVHYLAVLCLCRAGERQAVHQWIFRTRMHLILATQHVVVLISVDKTLFFVMLVAVIVNIKRWLTSYHATSHLDSASLTTCNAPTLAVNITVVTTNICKYRFSGILKSARIVKMCVIQRPSSGHSNMSMHHLIYIRIEICAFSTMPTEQVHTIGIDRIKIRCY